MDPAKSRVFFAFSPLLNKRKANVYFYPYIIILMRTVKPIRFLGLLFWYGYASVVSSWFLLHSLFADAWGWLFLLNTLAVYLVLPLPVWGIRPFFTRQKMDWFLWLGVVAVLLSQFGALFLPKPTPQPGGPALTVSTYNLLASNDNLDGIKAALLASDADIIAVQELSLAHASMLRTDLIDAYPYQLLDPRESVYGMGILSRYPLTPPQVPFITDLPYVGGPQLVEVRLGETAVQIINFHAIPPYRRPIPDAVSTALRAEQAAELAEYAASSPYPLIALGDLNATDQSEAYRLMQREYQDAWRTAGWGFGHTWPGLRFSYLGLVAPRWLVRIDYIFATASWQIRDAQLAPWDGGADHRPVVATLQLRTQPGNGRRTATEPLSQSPTN